MIKKALQYLKAHLMAGIIFFIIGLVFGYSGNTVIRSGKIKNISNSLINPFSEVNLLADKEIEEYEELETALSEYADNLVKNDHLTSFSVYVREFGTGRWVGVGEDERYAPASMLKVPLMVAYLKMTESKPDILSEKITYSGGISGNENQYFNPAENLKLGTYTIKTMIEKMIVESDNISDVLLENKIDKNFYKEVYTDLGLPFRYDQKNLDFMPTKIYATIFRKLYNATYLNREMSEYALNLMNQSTFNQGIVAGLSANIKVAHKYGERRFSVTNSSTGKLQIMAELHDCGIVYAPQNPYVLCIMTSGKDIKELVTAISDATKVVHEYVTK